MVRALSLLQAVLLAALTAMPGVHGVALEDPSATSRLHQGPPGHLHVIGGAVITGPASAAVQAAFDRETSAAAGSPLRKLLQGRSKLRVKTFPACTACKITRCVDGGKSICFGLCRNRNKLFNCSRRSNGIARTSPPPKKEYQSPAKKNSRAPPKKKSPPKNKSPPRKSGSQIQKPTGKATAKASASSSSEATGTSTNSRYDRRSS